MEEVKYEEMIMVSIVLDKGFNVNQIILNLHLL